MKSFQFFWEKKKSISVLNFENYINNFIKIPIINKNSKLNKMRIIFFLEEFGNFLILMQIEFFFINREGMCYTSLHTIVEGIL